MKQSIAHILWLVKQMIVLSLRGDWSGVVEAYWWLRVHLTYRGRRKE